MMKTFVDNAPDEEGVQLLLSSPLYPAERQAIENLRTADYVIDPDQCFINCEGYEREAVKRHLYKFGYVEALASNLRVLS